MVLIIIIYVYFFLGAYLNGMTFMGLNILDHMYMAEVVAMILVTAMTIQVKIKLKKRIGICTFL